MVHSIEMEGYAPRNHREGGKSEGKKGKCEAKEGWQRSKTGWARGVRA